MKRVLFIDTGLEFGGGTKSLLALLNGLIEQNIRLEAYFLNDYKTPDNKQISAVLNQIGVKVIPPKPIKKINKLKKEILRLLGKEWVLRAEFKIKLKQARELLSELKPDVIHLNNHFSTNLEYIKAANELGIKVIQHLRKNAAIEPFKLKILKNLDFAPICVSNSTYEFYNSMIKIKKHIVYDPFTVDKSSDLKPSKQNHPLSFLMAANYLSLKGHELVFDAFLALKRSDVRLLLAGSGELTPSARTKLEKLKSQGIASELGFVSNMSSVYEMADFLIIFSSNEGLPRVAIEALSKGLGIIFSDIAVAHELKELCTQKEKFFIVKREPNKLSNLMQNLQSSPKIPDQNIIDKFSQQAYISEVLKIYKELNII